MKILEWNVYIRWGPKVKNHMKIQNLLNKQNDATFFSGVWHTDSVEKW